MSSIWDKSHSIIGKFKVFSVFRQRIIVKPIFIIQHLENHMVVTLATLPFIKEM
jgi:hypothetical protein